MKKSGDQKDDKKNTGIVSFQLNALASSIFVVIALFIPDFIRSARPQKFEYFSRLPEDIVQQEIASYLNPVEKRNLALSYKENLRLIKPLLGMMHFQTCVAQGKQSEAQRLLQESKTKDKRDNPNLLLAVETFTDYSGRTFTCTAYEYAWWAKDRHMLRMLESHMDEPTKEAMSKRIDALEQQGLTYTQHGKTIKGSKHFDITPLKTAYEDYIPIYTEWVQADYPPVRRAAVVAALMQVGKAQRDLPVHYVYEYFRDDRSFHPALAFNEDELPRELTFNNHVSGNHNERLFPLVLTRRSGLGVDFALTRGSSPPPPRIDGRPLWRSCTGNDLWTAEGASVDLAAACRLDEVRTNDLMQSRKNLEPTAPMHGMSR